MASFFNQSATDQSSNQQQSQNQTQQQSQNNLFGNLDFFRQGFPSLYQPGGGESAILGQIQGLSAQPRYTPQMSQGMRTIQNLLQEEGNLPSESPYARTQATSMGVIQELLNSRDPRALQTIQQLLSQAMQGPTQLETQGLGTLQGRTDPGALTSAAEQYMRLIGEPSARAASVAGGMGGVRGGAFQEGLARESGRLALPIAQMIQQAQGEYGGAQMGLGANVANRQAGLASLLEQMRSDQTAEQAGLASQLLGMRTAGDARTSQLAAQLFGMGQADSRLGELGILQAGAQAAGMGRMGGIQDLLRQQQLAMLSRGMNTTGSSSGGSSGTGGITQQSPLTLGSVLGPTAYTLASLLSGPGGKDVVSGVGGGLSSLYNSLFGPGAATSSQFPSMVDQASDYSSFASDFGGYYP